VYERCFCAYVAGKLEGGVNRVLSCQGGVATVFGLSKIWGLMML